MKSKSISMLLTTCFLFLIFAQPGSAQHTKRMTFESEDGEIAIVMGLGAIIKGGEKGLVIEIVPDKSNRDKKYKNVDIQNQDKIIMCNGKKVKTVDDLNAAMDAVEIGGEISFGVRRGKEMLIVSFPKADPSDGGNMMMMTTTIDGDGTDNETSIMKDGVEMKDILMLEAGMILKDIDNRVTVLALVPEFEQIIDGEKPQDGDIIISINGDKILTSKELNTIYNNIKYGDMITMIISRNAKEFKLSFSKPKVDSGNSDVIITN